MPAEPEKTTLKRPRSPVRLIDELIQQAKKATKTDHPSTSDTAMDTSDASLAPPIVATGNSANDPAATSPSTNDTRAASTPATTAAPTIAASTTTAPTRNTTTPAKRPASITWPPPPPRPAPNAPALPAARNNPQSAPGGPPPGPYTPIFLSADEARHSLRCQAARWRPPFPDASIPTTTAGELSFIRAAVHCIDGGLALQPGARRSQRQVEARAWMLLDAQKRLHEAGCVVREAQDVSALNGGEDRQLGFRDRWVEVCKMVRKWSRIAQHVVDGPENLLDGFVAAPKAIYMKEDQASRAREEQEWTPASDYPPPWLMQMFPRGSPPTQQRGLPAQQGQQGQVNNQGQVNGQVQMSNKGR